MGSEVEADLTFKVTKSEHENGTTEDLLILSEHENGTTEDLLILSEHENGTTEDLLTLSEHENAITEDLLTLVAANTVQENHIVLEKKSSSSSSSSSSSGDLEFELASTESNRLLSGEVAAPNLDNHENGIPISSMPMQETNLSNELNALSESPTQSPPEQVMERPADTAQSKYRIPSHIFSRTNQADWSAASNESLFSIHTGNMSFRGDHVGWFGLSGELGLHADPTLSHIDYMSNQPPSVQAQINKSTELGRQNPVVGVTESKAAETMREVIRESEADASKEKLNSKSPKHSASFRRSDASGASVKSFAFPILTGENKDSQKQRTPSRGPSRASSQPQTPKAAKEMGTQKKGQPQPQMAALGVVSRWFSCVLCRSCCS